MELLHQNFDTLVVVGSWNKYIFSENWIVENILGEGVRYSIQYPLNAIGSLKFSLENISFCIFGERLVFQLNNNSENAYREIVKIARKIFQKLIHTPVTALGVNFVYSSNETLCELDNLPQSSNLIQTLGYDIISSQLTRTFKISEQETLNLKTELKEHNIIYDFNFNYNITSLSNVLDIIGDKDDLILEKREITNKVTSTVYKNERE